MAGYVFAGAALAFLAFLVWFAIRERRAGAVTEQAKVAVKTVETIQKMDEAAAKTDPTKGGVKQSLEEGTF